MNTSGIVAIGIGLVVVAVMRSVRSLRAEIAEMKYSLTLVMREIESHEWQVQNFEPPGKWRDDMLALLTDAKKTLAAAEVQALRVHVSPRMRRRARQLQQQAMDQLRMYRRRKFDAELWSAYLASKQIDEIPHA